MTRFRMRLLCIGALAVLAGGVANAAPIVLGNDIAVQCHGVDCGSMRFTTYRTYEDPAQGPPNPFPPFGGVEIEGTFTPAAGVQNSKLHYVQSVNRTTSPPNWRGDGTVVTVPFIDTPPGGYQGGPEFDYKVYYDEGEFPQFYDKPGGSVGLLKALKAAGNKFEVDFETWLMCTIEEIFNGNKVANDDRYRLAPLLGWTWGFTAEYVDNGDGVDDELDIVTTKSVLQTIGAISADFTAALGRVYGTAPNTDRFNVTIGDCQDCQLPTPGTYVLMLVAIAALVLARRRAGGLFRV